MTFTYALGSLNTLLPQVRLLIHDTDVDDQLLQDEEIDFFITSEGTNPYRVAWRAAETIAAKFARVVDKELGPLRDYGSQKQGQYTALASDLKKKMLRAGPLPSVSGLSLSQKQAVAADPDRVPNIFRREEFIIPGTENVLGVDQESGVPSA